MTTVPTQKYIRDIVSSILNTNKYSLIESKKTFNNYIYKICYKNNYYALKLYRKDKDKYINERMKIETNALKLLRNNGVRNIPEVFDYNLYHNCVVLSWVSGRNITRINKDYVNEAIKFQKRMKTVGQRIPFEKVNRGIGTFFSASGLYKDIEKRYSLLINNTDKNFVLFLKKEFWPLYKEVLYLAKTKLIDYNIKFNQNIDIRNRVLTQQDFGFQNCLVREKKLYFVDFEYFGWDDPVKFIADTLQHPHLNNISTNMEYFSKKLRQVYITNDLEEKRLKSVYNLHGLRWCLIMGNFFLRKKLVTAHDKKEKIILIRKKMMSIVKNLYGTNKNIA